VQTLKGGVAFWLSSCARYFWGPYPPVSPASTCSSQSRPALHRLEQGHPQEGAGLDGGGHHRLAGPLQARQAGQSCAVLPQHGEGSPRSSGPRQKPAYSARMSPQNCPKKAQYLQLPRKRNYLQPGLDKPGSAATWCYLWLS